MSDNHDNQQNIVANKIIKKPINVFNMTVERVKFTIKIDY